MCVCVIVKRPVLPPCDVDGRSRNPLHYYYYYPSASLVSISVSVSLSLCLSLCLYLSVSLSLSSVQIHRYGNTQSRSAASEVTGSLANTCTAHVFMTVCEGVRETVTHAAFSHNTD